MNQLACMMIFHSELNWCSDEQSGPTSSCSLFPVMSSTFYVHINSLNNALICLCFMIIITAWCVKNYLINLPFKNMRYDYLRNKSIDSRNVRERFSLKCMQIKKNPFFYKQVPQQGFPLSRGTLFWVDPQIAASRCGVVPQVNSRIVCTIMEKGVRQESN